ncbi:MAG TPA: hypothetical protein VF838_05285 [Trebonia sp.]
MLVHHDDFPAGAGRAGCRDGEVASEGGVEGTEQPVIPGPFGALLQGSQRHRHLRQRRGRHWRVRWLAGHGRAATGAASVCAGAACVWAEAAGRLSGRSAAVVRPGIAGRAWAALAAPVIAGDAAVAGATAAIACVILAGASAPFGVGA